MSAQKSNLDKIVRKLFIIVLILFILLLTSINIDNYVKPREVRVLGAQTNTDSEINSEQLKFWDKFLTENPNYIPGWIEIGRNDKAREIDPNFRLE